jgi:hypothetical protein
MANNRFNKQVTPKGYKVGGRVKKMGGGMMMQRPIYKDGSKVRKLPTEVSKKEADKKLKSKKTMMPDLRNRKSLIPLPSEIRDMKEKIKKKKETGKKDIFDYIGDVLSVPYKIRGGNAKGGRIKKMGGGSLKSVPAGNKGLKKLPTQVRNKMGFMKKGGVVSDTKKKQFKANQAGSIKMAKKVLTDNLAGDIYKDKRVRKFASKVKEGLKNSPLNLKGAAEGYINLGKKITKKFKGDK